MGYLIVAATRNDCFKKTRFIASQLYGIVSPLAVSKGNDIFFVYAFVLNNYILNQHACIVAVTVVTATGKENQNCA